MDWGQSHDEEFQVSTQDGLHKQPINMQIWSTITSGYGGNAADHPLKYSRGGYSQMRVSREVMKEDWKPCRNLLQA